MRMIMGAMIMVVGMVVCSRLPILKGVNNAYQDKHNGRYGCQIIKARVNVVTQRAIEQTTAEKQT